MPALKAGLGSKLDNQPTDRAAQATFCFVSSAGGETPGFEASE